MLERRVVAGRRRDDPPGDVKARLAGPLPVDPGIDVPQLADLAGGALLSQRILSGCESRRAYEAQCELATIHGCPPLYSDLEILSGGAKIVEARIGHRNLKTNAPVSSPEEGRRARSSCRQSGRPASSLRIGNGGVCHAPLAGRADSRRRRERGGSRSSTRLASAGTRCKRSIRLRRAEGREELSGVLPPRRLDPARAPRATSAATAGPIDHNRGRQRERLGLAGVIEMEVGVQDISHVAKPDPMGPQLSVERLPGLLEAAQPDPLQDFGMPEPGVDDDDVLGTDEQEALDRKPNPNAGALVATVRLPSISSEPRSRTLISHAKPQPLLHRSTGGAGSAVAHGSHSRRDGPRLVKALRPAKPARPLGAAVPVGPSGPHEGRAGIHLARRSYGSRIGLRPFGTTHERAEPGSPSSDCAIVVIRIIVVILLIIVLFLSEFVRVDRRCGGEAAPCGRVSPGFLTRACARGGEIPGPRG
jgi:hypothetical protein